MKMTTRLTERGFRIYEFDDSYGDPCTLQQSSNMDPHIWFGGKGRVVLEPSGGHGWREYPLPEGAIVLGDRMHLDQEQVAALIPMLQHFVDTGHLPGEDDVDQ